MSTERQPEKSLLEAVALWAAPLQGPSPAGKPARGDDTYERLRAEIAKLNAADGAGPSWSDVYQLSSEILSTKSKDLTVASYLCAALVAQNGAEGLHAGLKLYRDLLVQYWTQLYPELDRVRGRVSAIAWLNEQGAKALKRRTTASADAAALAAAEPLLGEIDTLLQAQLGEASPGVSGLRQAVREAVSLLQAESEPSPTAAATEASATQPAALLEVASESDAKQVLQATAEQLRRLARYRRAAQATDASAYRLLRMGEWLPIERTPPATDGATLIPPPLDLRSRIEQLSAAGNWPKLIEAAEQELRSALFWFDLQWHVAQAMQTLGRPWDDARRAVAMEVGHLLARLPGVELLKFRDGTPFADEATLKWMEAECRIGAGGRPPVAPEPLAVPEATPPDVVEAVERELGEASRLAASGKLAEALGRLTSRSHATESRREKFLWRWAEARLLSDMGRADLGKAVLEALDEDIRQVTVADWDLPLTVRVVRTLLECQRQLMKRHGKPTQEAVDRARQLHERLARLDPAAAIAVDPLV